jgi:hypothetical protein
LGINNQKSAVGFGVFVRKGVIQLKSLAGTVVTGDRQADQGIFADITLPSCVAGAETHRIEGLLDCVHPAQLTRAGVEDPQFTPVFAPVQARRMRYGLDVSGVITHRFPIEDYTEGFATMRSVQTGKVVLDWQGI